MGWFVGVSERGPAPAGEVGCVAAARRTWLDAGARGGRHGSGGLAVLPRRCARRGLSRWPDVAKGGRRRPVPSSVDFTHVLCRLHPFLEGGLVYVYKF